MTAAPVDGINALAEDALRLELRHCCASMRWVETVAAARPYASADALLQYGDHVLEDLADEDWLEAFAGAGVREPPAGDEATRSALRVALRLYEERFDYPFVIAEHLGGDELLMRVRIRLGLEPAAQFRASRAEQRRLTHVRLQRLIERTGTNRGAHTPAS